MILCANKKRNHSTDYVFSFLFSSCNLPWYRTNDVNNYPSNYIFQKDATANLKQKAKFDIIDIKDYWHKC